MEDLRKVYGSTIMAIDGISFTVRRGEIFGFLGPNGAGKSTTIKILTTLLNKTSGTAIIDGLDVDTDQSAVRRIIGYASQEVGVDDDLTARENLLLQCRFHHIEKGKAVKITNELLQTVKLTDAADRRLSTYSGGMRKRLDLASALVSNPKVLFLDEPTTGLDPQSRLDIWEYITQLNHEGMTIFLTTQYMEEADRLANRLCIVDQGKIVADGAPVELKSRIGTSIITLRLKSGDPKDCEKAQVVIAGLEGIKEVGTCSMGLTGNRSLTIMAENGAAMIPQIVKAVDNVGVDVEQLTLSEPTLDEVFLKLTGRTFNVVERKQAIKKKGFGGRRRT